MDRINPPSAIKIGGRAAGEPSASTRHKAIKEGFEGSSDCKGRGVRR